MKLLTTTEAPVLLMKNKLFDHPQIGNGIADLIAAVTPGLVRRGTSTRSNIDYQLLENEQDSSRISDRIANNEWKKRKRELIAKKQQLSQLLAENEEMLELMDQRENELQKSKI